ncbi:MAG TPA: efflux RND transporter periplasmic adaptor subunit [Geminicoccaceae bacterium]|nr:efflux RND transporter periplasmic adaptor subunit [Geminicoccaceae bacterium]
MPSAAAPPPAVSVVQVESRDVTPSTQYVGRVAAIGAVDLRARVTGFLERGSSTKPRALFIEGQDVQKGDLLYLIEQPPFEAQVAAAKAQVAEAEARVAEANATLQRVQEAVTSGAVSKQEVDQATAAAQEAEAQVLLAKAQLRTAEINLGYTEIYAPISGKIGLTRFTFGNLVGPTSGVLATIVSQDPIYITFPVSAAVIVQMQNEARGSLPPPDSFVVRIVLPDGTTYPQPGEIDFLSNQVDQTTDTLTVRAAFPNPRRILVDGQFVTVTVETATPVTALVVPQPAVQTDQTGTYVFVVDNNQKVEQRRVTLGTEHGTDVVVQSGLKQGEKVIVEGIQKVRPGIVVTATEAQPMMPGGAAGAAATPEKRGRGSGAAARDLPSDTALAFDATRAGD